VTIRAARYAGNLRFPDAETSGLLDAVNPALGPVLGLVVNLNDTYSGISVARAENLTDLTFFRRAFSRIRPEYQFTVATAARSRTSQAYPPMSVWIPGGGKGPTREAALMGAIAEYFERYYGSFAYLEPEPRSVFGTADALQADGRTVVGSDQLQFFDDSQFRRGFPYVPFTGQSRLSWTAFADAIDGGEVMVPAQIAYLTRARRQGEDLVTYSTTGGLAFGRDFQDAFQHGLLEYIERDAINLAWVARQHATRLRLDAPELAAQLRRLLGTLGQDLHLVLFPTDAPGVSVIGAFGYYNNLFVSGAGADLTFEGALLKAAGEIMQCFDSLRDTLHLPAAGRPVLAKDDLFEFSLILQYYSQPEQRRRVLDWMNALPEASASELRVARAPGRLDELVQGMYRQGHRVLVKDFEVQRHLPSGRGALVRVFVPTLIPAHVPNMPFLGHSRYRVGPAGSDAQGRPRRFDDLYTDEPVPLP
jgi:thiazole/oxazole-forming peptide maturase SagD family component